MSSKERRVTGRTVSWSVNSGGTDGRGGIQILGELEFIVVYRQSREYSFGEGDKNFHPWSLSRKIFSYKLRKPGPLD